MNAFNITIAICNFKQKKWIHRCLRSLADQTIGSGKFEIIVVNDDPDDDLTAIIKSWSDIMNIRLFNNDVNIGLPASLNVALENSRGRYFFRVDADDYISKHTLYVLSLFLDMNRDYQAVACDYNEVDNLGKTLARKHSEDDPIACGIMFTYESLCDVGFYDKTYKMREGHELLKRYVKRHNIYYMPMPFYRYRKHNDNRTNDIANVAIYDERLQRA